MADEEVTQEEILASMHRTVSGGIDRLFQLAFATYVGRIEDETAIYRMFVGILAQTLGRHIAGFPEEERILMETEALSLQEEMTELTVQEFSSQPDVEPIITGDKPKYDLANMKPMGNA